MKIAVGSIVRLVSDPLKKGAVMAVAGEGPDAQYTLFLDNNLRKFYAEQIEPCEVKTTNWVTREEFRSYLTSCLINTPSSKNLYSLNAARIDFVPYQFRPALKILNADEPRILIADSVGVGKTIEAGLIIKELEAHLDVDSICIICPKPLVAERKWELEMRQKFDEEFVAMDGPTLRQALSETDRDGGWPVRYKKVIIPYSVFDELSFEGNGDKPKGVRGKGRAYGIREVAKFLHFDLAIVDEAHHIRNGSEKSEKAYAYKCVKAICDHADAVTMMTATPLQTSSRDLYTLLNTLLPETVLDYETYQRMAEPNPFVSQCSALIRAAEDGWQAGALTCLDKIGETFWGRETIAKSPAYAKIRATLEKPELTREERVRLITEVKELHSFYPFISRTRRRDIGEFCIRDPKTLKTTFTPAQQRLHDKLLSFEHQTLALLHGERGVKFMMSTLRRQAASCIFGLAPLLHDILGRRLAEIAGEEGDEEIGKIPASTIEQLKTMAAHLMEMAADLPPDDLKFDKVLEVIRTKQDQPKNKIMLFSSFKHTLAYIREKLKGTDIRFAQMDGDVPDEDRCELTRRFKLPREDAEALDLLLFTEVSAEGLDYQVCDMMVNYDLPWNPMAVEQRIGRIDRRGQKAEKVTIVNVITENTVDADIYERCLSRIGVFRESIDDCEEIFGDIASSVRDIALDDALTPEQRREKMEQITDNGIRLQQEEKRLEEAQKAFFGLDLTRAKDAADVEEARSPWLSADCLQGLIAHYLNVRIGPGSYFLGAGGRKTMRLAGAAKEKLLEDTRRFLKVRSSVRDSWERYLKNTEPTCPVTFEREIAQEDAQAHFFNAVHPLVIQAAQYLSQQATAEGETPCIAFRYRTNVVPPGEYPFAVYTWNYSGFAPKFKMVTVPVDPKLESVLPKIVAEAGEYLPSAENAAELWDRLEPIHTALWRQEKDAFVAETQARADYRTGTAKSSFFRIRQNLEKKIATNADPRSTRMFQAQLENAREKYERKLADFADKASKADIIANKIANGLIIVEG